MKRTTSAWWNQRAVERNQSTFALPAVRAWMKRTIENSVKCAIVKLPTISGPNAQAIPKRAMKLLRKIASGYRLIGVLEWGVFCLVKKTLTQVLSKAVVWLIDHDYIARGIAGGWSLTGAGKAALATRNGRAVTA